MIRVSSHRQRGRQIADTSIKQKPLALFTDRYQCRIDLARVGFGWRFGVKLAVL